LIVTGYARGEKERLLEKATIKEAPTRRGKGSVVKGGKPGDKERRHVGRREKGDPGSTEEGLERENPKKRTKTFLKIKIIRKKVAQLTIALFQEDWKPRKGEALVARLETNFEEREEGWFPQEDIRNSSKRKMFS